MLKRLEKYEIVDEIGHGGMATVYRARDTRLDRRVALKVMHPHLQGAKEARQRFAREALTVARLRHPSILEIYDYSGEESETSFIAAELLTGPTLQAIRRRAPGDPGRDRRLHRDPGRARARCRPRRGRGPSRREAGKRAAAREPLREADRLRDRPARRRPGHDHDRAGARLPGAHGARADRGPRVRSAQRPVLARHRALHARRPASCRSRATTRTTVLKRIMEGKYKDPLQARPAIGGKLAGIIRRLLQVDPALRYPNAEELERDLTHLRRRDSASIRPTRHSRSYLAGTAEASPPNSNASAIDKLIELGEQSQRRGSMPTRARLLQSRARASTTATRACWQRCSAWAVVPRCAGRCSAHRRGRDARRVLVAVIY